MNPDPFEDFTARAGFASNNGAEWPDGTALEEYLSPVLPMTRDMMPEPLANFAGDIAKRIRCPLDFVGVSSVIMISSAIASRVRIHPQHYGSWEIAPNLWGGIIGQPGAKKTPAARASLSSSIA